MIDGKYYADGECFCKCLSHAKSFDGKDMVWVEAWDFSEYGVSKYDKLFWTEEACDRRFVESTEKRLIRLIPISLLFYLISLT